MVVAIAEPIPRQATAVRNDRPPGISVRGVALSAALHLVLGAVLIVGLPHLFAPPPMEEAPVAVELVTIAPETRATHPNPSPPQPDAKPLIPELETPVAKPEPKLDPPKPAPVPPSSAAAPPPPPAEPTRLPEPKPAPPVTVKPPEPKPEPKPLETAEVPKPKEKPEPPKQMVKNEPQLEQKKYDPGQFAALLKNLAPQQAAPSPDAPPEKPHAASARASSQPKAPMGSQLTASELDMVRHQIAQCWNVPAGARDAPDLVVEIRVAVDPDGTVMQATIVDQGRLGDPFFRAAAESARRAFFNPQCRPLHLPTEKYAIWKDLVVDFSPKDIL
jgi:outer membrane biosynthesis protein TonB